MKRFTLAAGAGLLALAMASPSFAADMPRPAYKAPMYVAPSFSWTGFYVGANLGYGWGTTNWTNTIASTGDFNTKGWLGGGTIGYNMQTGAFVWGLEGDFALSENRGTESTVCGGGCTTRNLWLATGRGRIGYSFDRFLPYITGGVAAGSVKMTTVLGDQKETRWGWTLGAGLEYAFMGAWSAKLEYLYADLGNSSCGVAVCGINTTVKFRTNIVRAGINYRF